MKSILVDKQYLSYNTSNTGIIFIISTKVYNKLKSLPKSNMGKKRIDYVNSDKFNESVIASYSITYNKSKNTCSFDEPMGIMGDSHSKLILNTLLKYLPANTNIYVSVHDDKEVIDSYERFGFEKHGNIGKKTVVLYRKNIPLSTMYKNICKIYARFSNQTLNRLKNLNNPSQKNELSGSLSISNIKNKNVLELTVNAENISHGKAEEVNAVISRYNFHTHPKQAYINNNVINGWPSSQDAIGFLTLNHRTVFHTVVTLEGIYIISFSEEWINKNGVKNVNKISDKWVNDNYDIDHLENITPHEYIKRINKIRYKNVQLLDYKYMPWNKATKIFSVFYSKINNKCLATDEEFKTK